ncbi:heme/hemin ABC transporter substrate-binding protein [Spirosoma endophyticum]|uniref:Iron complex transport system substrate-binding protein n=1 Tax=Spirosoma endophyticum TaxID=662367 RepID=A0A1I1VL70_9BACT|nr:ABC transporter substrate-binding protein [Spirosoma endophyticum]SFD83564.1 iron complex transport system substrate-binding protein [Spirosoma endophyticum]
MKIIKTALLLALVTLGIVACTSNKKDQTEATTKQRIVCVAKQLTELIYALGAGDQLVGVDLSSTYPPAAQKLTKVGYHRLLNSEGIIALKPTVVYHDGNVAPEAVMEQLKKVGVPMKVFPDAHTIPEVKALFDSLAAQFGAQKQADSLKTKLDADLAKAANDVKQYKTTPNVAIIHFGRVINNYLVIGKAGTASYMLGLAGGKNVMDTLKGMKPLSPEIISKAQPDIILVTDFGYDRLGNAEKLATLPGIALTPAGKNKKIYRIEEHDLIYLGPRTGENVQMLMKLIHQ